MVCPPEVGQPGAKTCLLYFSQFFESGVKEVTQELFKKMILFFYVARGTKIISLWERKKFPMTSVKLSSGLLNEKVLKRKGMF